MQTKPVQGPDIDKVMAATRGSSIFEGLDDSQLRQAVAQAQLLQFDAGESLIREGKNHQIVSSMQTAKAAGNRLLNDSLADLVRGGIVEHEEALSKAVDKKDLAMRLGRGAG